MAMETPPCFETVGSSNLCPGYVGALFVSLEPVSRTKVNVLAARGCLCLGIRQITFDKTRQKLGRGLYYVKHRSKGLDQLLISETNEAVVLRRSAQ
jgi:hypothetical protein